MWLFQDSVLSMVSPRYLALVVSVDLVCSTFDLPSIGDSDVLALPYASPSPTHEGNQDLLIVTLHLPGLLSLCRADNRQ